MGSAGTRHGGQAGCERAGAGEMGPIVWSSPQVGIRARYAAGWREPWRDPCGEWSRSSEEEW